MATKSTGLTPSTFGAQEALLDLADHFFEPDSYSTLKSGLLGFMTASMGRIAGEGAFHRNVLFRENFLNTASLPRSIYNYAKIYDYTVGLATPSTCRALVGLYLDEVRSAIGSEAGTLTLPRGQQVFLGSTPFILAGAVSLHVLEDSRVTAEYDTASMDFPLVNGSSYVRTYMMPQVVGNNGETRTVVFMEVHLHQAVPRVQEFQVVSSSSMENSFYQVALPPGSQLASFRVMYREAGEASWRRLPAYFNETVTPDENEFCFYSFSGDSEIEVFFSPLPGLFRPAYNSQLRVEFLTTDGTGGNFDFTGTPSITVAGVQRGMASMVELVTMPAGGRNMETLLEVKRGILRKILQRNSIIIERDLEDYLSQVIDRTQVNQSQLNFIKRRDDIQTRLFASFMLVRDSAGRVVPTNTVPLDLEVADLEARGWSLKPGTLIVYDRRNDLYRLLGPGEYPDRMATDPNSFVYCVPFLMEFRTTPFPRLVYYRNQVEIDQPLTAQPGDVVVSDSFLANSVTVRRNSAFENTYQMDVALTSNLGNDVLRARCLLRARFFSEKGDDLGYAEATHLQGTNMFRAMLTTEDAFDEKSQMLLTNSLWNEVDGTLMPAAPITEKVKVRLELYYNNANPDTSGRFVERDGQIFQLVHIFQTHDSISLYNSLERVMASGMHVTESGTFHCNDVPLVGASYFLNPRISREIMGVVEAYHGAILETFDLLHNNTSVDVKLFNTYGPSKAFSLDRVNLSIALGIRPRGRANEALRSEVIRQTSAFVLSCNENDKSRFSISNLIRHLENEIEEIAYIRFDSLNGVAAQNVEHIYASAALEQDNKRVPELLNVTTMMRSSLDQDPYVPDVRVTFI